MGYCLLLLAAVGAGEARLTIEPTVANTVNANVYGHFLEHIYQSVHGGLDAELCLDGDFEIESSGVAVGDGYALEAGSWSVDGEIIRQRSMATAAHLFWTAAAGSPNYRFSLEAKRGDGPEGFLIVFGAADSNNFCWWNLGGWGNQYSAVERETDGRRGALGETRTETRIDRGRWYRIEVDVRGDRAELFLDGQRMTQVTGVHPGGFVGVGSWATPVEYRGLTLSVDGASRSFPLEALAGGTSAAAAFAGGWEPDAAGRGELTGQVLLAETSQGERSQRLILVGAGPHGVLSRAIAVEPGVYAGRVAVRGRAVPRVHLRDQRGVLAEATLPANRGDGWQLREFRLTVPRAAEARLGIGPASAGTLDVDSLSLRPTDETGEPRPFRPDLLEAIRELRPPVIRWPGGCFAERYVWRDAVGPRETRPRRWDQMWDYRDPNWFGTDEFVALCREVGAEPMICFNVAQHGEEADAPLAVRDALDWIEYCNGGLDTDGGRLRAMNGHPAPYNIKYWEIGNECWPMTIDRYLERARMFCEAIRAKHPDLILAVCGSGGHNHEWNRRLVEGLGGLFDQLSLHHYGGGPDYLGRMANAAAYVDFVSRTRDLCRGSAAPETEIAVTEWNLMSTGLDSGLWAGIFLIGCERLGDCVTMANPALFLRETTAPAWDNALINIGPRGWFAGGNYLAMKLLYDHYVEQRLAGTLTAGTLGQFGETRLDEVYAVAGRDARRLVIKAVNVNPSEPVALTIDTSLRLGDTAQHSWLTGEGPDTRNALDAPDRLRIQSREVRLAAPPVVELPPHSVNAIVIDLLGG